MQIFALTFCDPAGTRTQDPMIKSQLLYQLSYGIRMVKVLHTISSIQISLHFILFKCQTIS